MERSREFVKAAIIAVVVPLFLAFIGLVFFTMFTQSPDAVRLRLPALMEDLKNQPPSGWKNAPPYTDLEAVRANLHNFPQKVRDIVRSINAVEKDAEYQETRRIIALLIVVAGVIAAGVGAAGLAGTLQAGTKAKQSRDYLIAAFARGRVILPLLMIIQSSALVVALAAISGFLAYGGYVRGVDSEDNKITMAFGLFSLALLGFGGVMIWRLAKSLRTVFTLLPDRVHGRAIGKAEAPELWSFVSDIAHRIQAEVPDNIVLGLDRGFYVTARQIIPAGGAVLSGKTLHMPLPQLAFLDRDETAAIVGHELGHFTGEDLEYSLKFLPIYNGAAQSIRAVEEGQGDADRIVNTFVIKPLFSVAEFFLSTFDGVVNHWSRVRELEADKAGVAAASARASASALIRSSVNASGIGQVLREVWESPDKEHGDILAEMLERVREQGFEDPKMHLEDEQVHPTDTHPPTRLRVEAMGLSCDDAGLLRDALRTPDMARSVVGELLPRAEELCSNMVVDFRQAATRHHEEVTAALEEAVAVSEAAPFPIEESLGKLVALEVGVAAILIIFGVYSFGTLKFGAQCFLWGLIALVLWGVRHFYMRMRLQPSVTLTAEGFRCPSLVRDLPWSDVEGYELSDDTSGKMITIDLFLKESAPAPERRKSPITCKYVAKKHRLRVSMMSVKRPDKRPTIVAIEEELELRLRGVAARAALEEKKKADG